MSKRVLFYIAFVTLVFFSCGKPPKPFQGSQGVLVLPTVATVTLGQTQQFEATVFNVSSGVTWSVDGGDANGTIDTNGLYTAPSTLPAGSSVVVRAKLSSNNQVQDTAEVSLTSP